MESYLFRSKVTSKLPQSYLFELARKSYFSRDLKKSYLSYLSYLLFIYFLNFFKNKKYVDIYGLYIIWYIKLRENSDQNLHNFWSDFWRKKGNRGNFLYVPTVSEFLVYRSFYIINIIKPYISYLSYLYRARE